MGERADDDAAGRSGRLQARRGIHRVAGEEALARAGVDAEAHEVSPVLTPTRTCERVAVGPPMPSSASTSAQAGAHGALGVVLVDVRKAEDADHGVADELLDGAAVGLDQPCARRVVACAGGVDVLGVGGLGVGGEGDKVAEEGGDDLALLGAAAGAAAACRNSGRS